jgi:hypothetical protein
MSAKGQWLASTFHCKAMAIKATQRAKVRVSIRKQDQHTLGRTRSSYVKFTDVMEQSMSSQRQLDKLQAPIIVTYGTNETPEFQRQNRDFAAAVKAAGKPTELIETPDYNHFEMCESLGDPYGPNGRAALKLMELA